MASKIITNRLTLLRDIPFPVTSPETDWRLTNDVPGFVDATDPRAIVPKEGDLGFVDLVMVFLDADNKPIPIGSNVRVTVQPIEVLKLEGSGFDAPFLASLVDDLTIRGEQSTRVPDAFKVFTVVGLRVVSTQSLPGSYSRLLLCGKYG